MDQVLHKRVFSSAFTWIVQNKSLIRLIKISYVLSKSSTHVFSNQTENFTPSLPCRAHSIYAPVDKLSRGGGWKYLDYWGREAVSAYRSTGIEAFRLNWISTPKSEISLELNYFFLSLQILFLMNNFPHEYEQVQTVLIKRKSNFFF